MAIFRTQVTVLSGTTNVNLLTGSKFEFLSRPAVVNIFAVQHINAASNLELDVTLGNVVVGEDLAPNAVTSPAGPSKLNDGLGAGVGDAGDRIQIRARETTGGVGADGVLIVLLDIAEIA